MGWNPNKFHALKLKNYEIGHKNELNQEDKVYKVSTLIVKVANMSLRQLHLGDKRVAMLMDDDIISSLYNESN